MVHDRGTIKWTSMMLPEHATLLEEIWSEDKKEIKPILDEQELEHLNSELFEAYSEQYKIQVTTFQQGFKREYMGVVKKLIKHQNCIDLQDNYNERITIPLSKVIHITKIED